MMSLKRWTSLGVVVGALAFGVLGTGTTYAQSAVADVSVGDNFFSPASINVPPGTNVRWLNQGTRNHTATSDTGAFGSGTLAPGQSYSYLFNTPGTYAYHCVFHAGMVGQVRVEGSAPPPNSGANLALNRPVQASSAQAGYPPQLAVDGNPGSYWASAGATGPYGANQAMPEAMPEAAPDADTADMPSVDALPAPNADGALGQPEAAEPLSHNNQWIMVDLGGTRAVQRLHMLWTSRFARSYYVYVYGAGCSGWCSLGATSSGDGDDTLALSRAIQARYFLLQLVNPATPSAPYELREWEIFGSGGGGGGSPMPSQDVAAGRPAVASSQLPGYEAGRATDREMQSEWRPAGLPAWIYVDFGRLETVDRAVLRWAPGLHATTYALYAYTGYGWQGLRQVNSNGDEDSVTFNAVRTRYLLVHAQRALGPTVGLAEIEVWTRATSGGGYPYPLSSGEFRGLSEAAPEGSAIQMLPPASLPDLGRRDEQ